jgi:hypothetical protein
VERLEKEAMRLLRPIAAQPPRREGIEERAGGRLCEHGRGTKERRRTWRRWRRRRTE